MIPSPRHLQRMSLDALCALLSYTTVRPMRIVLQRVIDAKAKGEADKQPPPHEGSE